MTNLTQTDNADTVIANQQRVIKERKKEGMLDRMWKTMNDITKYGGDLFGYDIHKYYDGTEASIWTWMKEKYNPMFMGDDEDFTDEELEEYLIHMMNEVIMYV